MPHHNEHYRPMDVGKTLWGPPREKACLLQTLGSGKAERQPDEKHRLRQTRKDNRPKHTAIQKKQGKLPKAPGVI